MYFLSDPTLLDECKLDENTRAVLLEQIQRKLQSQAVKIRADIEVFCFEYEGIDAVKSALREGIKFSTQQIPIRINLIAPPLYVMTTQTTEKQDGLKALEGAIECVREKIVSYGGNLSVKMAPKVCIICISKFLLESLCAGFKNCVCFYVQKS